MPRTRKRRDAKPQEYDFSFPDWFSPWGALAVCSLALGLGLGSLVETRWLTILFTILGGSITALGTWKTKGERRRRDKIWLTASGLLSASILVLLVFAPGVLNGRWATDRFVPPPDLNLLTVVPRDKALEKGRPLAPDEVVDAATHWIRQDNVVVLIDSVKIGQVVGKGETPHLLIQIRIVNVGSGESVSLVGFAEHTPILSDGTGRNFTFVGQRLKRIKNKSVVFEDWRGNQSIEIQPRNAQDVQLIYASPGRSDDLHLELSSAAWGRVGMLKFHLANLSQK